jgi:hypothetical protein
MTRTLAPAPATASAQGVRPASLSPSSPLGDARRSDAELRRIVLRVRQWGLEQGRTCSTDALTAVAGVIIEEARHGQMSPLLWSAARVADVLAIGAPRYCARLDMSLPMGLSTALALWLDYLAALNVLVPGSDPMDRLRRALSGRRLASAAARRKLAPQHPAGTGLR